MITDKISTSSLHVSC